MSIRLRQFLQGFSGATELAIYNESFSARNFSSSPLAIPLTLEGDTYDYQLICFFANVSGDSVVDITLNSDTGTNYRNYEMKGLSGTQSAAIGEADTAIELQNLIGSASPNLLKMDIMGSSGDERFIDCFYNADGAVIKQSSYWKNTANELDEITITAASSVTCDAQIILYQTPKTSDQGTWELLQTKTWTTQNLSTTPVDFTGLDGDTDIQYKVEADMSSTAGNSGLTVRLNSDAGGNYTSQLLENNAGGISAIKLASQTEGFLFFAATSVNPQRTTLIVNAESGVKRLISGSTSKSGGTTQQDEAAVYWSNTASNLTAINIKNFYSVTSSGVAKLYRRISPTDTGDILPFETVNTVAVSGDFSAGDSYAINVDAFKLVKIEGLFSTVGNDLRLQIDGDTGNNYTDQYVKGVVTTASAAASGSIAYQLLCDASVSNMARFEYYIFPASGENRPSLLKVWHGEDSVEFKAGIWANSGDAINSFKIFASSTTTCTGEIKYSILR